MRALIPDLRPVVPLVEYLALGVASDLEKPRSLLIRGSFVSYETLAI